MKAAIYTSHARHHSEHAIAMSEGLKRHGIDYEFFSDTPPASDFIVSWGWRKARLWHSRYREVLVMERGYIGDRYKWTSLGWNGLNGRARWNAAQDDGNRLNKYYPRIMRPWKKENSGYALIIGQVPGDASIHGVDIDTWYNNVYEKLIKLGYDVKYRHHPLANRNKKPVPFASLDGELIKVLRGAQFVITYNSNTAVDAVVNGIPAITYDEGSMAWPVSSHKLTDKLFRGERKDWLIDLSWRQWNIEEIRSGFAWDIIKRQDLTNRKYTALVLGGGPNVWKEAEDAFNSYNIDFIIAINTSIKDFPGRLDMAITLHPSKLKTWLTERNNNGFPAPLMTVAHKTYDGVTNPIEYKWPEMKYSGSSGLFAVKAAFELLNASRVILAGVPMSCEPHYYKSKEQPWNDSRAFLPAWKQSLPRLLGKVKSYSGVTAELLGKPTKEWANG